MSEQTSSDIANCNLAQVIDALRRREPTFRYLALGEALECDEGAASIIAVSTSDMNVSSRMWDDAMRSQKIIGVVSDLPVDELRYERGFKTPSSKLVITATPYVGCRADASTENNSVSTLILRDASIVCDKYYHQIKLAIGMWLKAEGRVDDVLEVNAARTNELVRAISQLGEGGVCVDISGNSAFSELARSICAQLGYSYLAIGDRNTSLRLRLLGPLPACQNVKGHRFRELILALKNASSIIDESLIVLDFPEQEARRISMLLRKQREWDDFGHGLFTKGEYSWGDQVKHWPQYEESAIAATALFDAMFSFSVEWRKANLNDTLRPLCSLVGDSNRLGDESQFLKSTFFRSVESWDLWLDWVKRSEVETSDKKILPACNKCINLGIHLFAPEPMEVNWLKKRRLENRASLEMALKMVRLLRRRGEFHDQSAYLEIRYLIYLERLEEAVSSLEAFVAKHPVGENFLEPFVLDFWFCDGSDIAKVFLERLLKKGPQLPKPILHSCLLAGAVTQDVEVYRKFALIIDACDGKPSLATASAFHQLVWRRIAGIDVGDVTVQTKELLDVVTPFASIGSAMLDAIKEL